MQHQRPHQTEALSLENCLICLGGEKTGVITSVQQSLPYALECNLGYFTSVMQNLSQRLPAFADYTFVFTRSVTELPSKFSNTEKLVVLVMGDEWARVPTFTSDAHAVFKAPGQHIKLALHKRWLRFNAMALVQYLRLQLKRYPDFTGSPENLFAIPYGYYRLPVTNEVTPILERSIDASFTGSIDHKHAGGILRGIVKTNKVLSRERMVDIVTRWKRGKPYNIDVKLSTYFPKANDQPEFDSYPKILMDTKICLSPRGTHLETYRLCEGMYYGCIVIAEEQPDHWFARNSPAIILKDWTKLPQLLDDLLADEQRLQELQRASLDYWDSTLAPNAIADYMAMELGRLAGTNTASSSNVTPVVRKAA